MLKEMKRRYPNARDDDYVFQTPHQKTKKGQAISGAAVRNQLEAISEDFSPCTVHGFRTTFSMWAESQTILHAGARIRRYDDDSIERQINHKIPGTKGRYRHQGRGLVDPLLENRRDMMKHYAEFASKPEYSDVVDLSQHRSAFQ